MDTVETWVATSIRTGLVRNRQRTRRIKMDRKDGTPMFYGHIKRGLPVGQWKYWHRNGQLSQIRHYGKNGWPTGDWHIFTGAGDTLLSEHFENGDLVAITCTRLSSDYFVYSTYSWTDSTGGKQQLKYSMRSDSTVESFVCAGDTLLNTITYFKDEPDNDSKPAPARTVVRYFDGQNGYQALKVATYVNGRLHGPTIFFDSNGELVRKLNYEHGVLQVPTD